jgi:hypothetical protein
MAGCNMTNTKNNAYGDNEAERRFRQALRGALNTPPKPLKSMTPVGTASQQKKPKKGSPAKSK